VVADLERYRDDGCPLGDFLKAVVSNDLMEAASRADSQNSYSLPAYAGWLYNECPSAARGSKKAYLDWIEAKADERKKKETP
jgi:hypothetical protein